jgi:hypothetical protein
LVSLLRETEREVLKFSKVLTKEDSVVIDAGAYRGEYTIRFSMKAKMQNKLDLTNNYLKLNKKLIEISHGKI